MIQTTPNSTGALWARFRFSVVGSLLSCPPARSAQDGDPLPGCQDLVPSHKRMRSSVRGRHHCALVLRSPARAR